MTLRVYLAGPMGGIPGFNFDQFDAAARYLRALGHEAINPADIDRAAGIDLDRADWTVSEQERQDALARDYRELVTCDAIALLPGWQNSRGAQSERRVAEDIGLDVYLVEPWRVFAQEKPAVLIGLSGYAQSGKDTVGAMMFGLAEFERLAFADALKNVALASNPGMADIETVSLRSLVERRGWEQTKRLYPDSRVFLQHLGQAVRQHVSETAWIDAALRQVRPGGRYVITDVRYPNEFAAIKAKGGLMVRVERPGTGPANAHVSETALDDHQFDAVLRNTGSLDDLRSRVRIMLQTI